MPPAKRDDNRVTTILGKDSTDPTKVANVKVNPVTGAILCESINKEVSKAVGDYAPRDSNRVASMLGEDSTDPSKVAPPICDVSSNDRLVLEI